MATVTTAPAVQIRKRSQAKLIGFAVFFAVTAFVTYMKNARILDSNSEIARHFAPGTMFLIPHAIFSTVAFVMGAFQFSDRLRAKYLRVHRAMGYVYVFCVLIGAPMAIPLAVKVATPSLVAATVAQTLGWVGCTLIALYCVRTGNVLQHRRWMFRGYPFAMIFTAARVIIPIPPVFRMGTVGIEIVVWTLIALAAFLPTVLLEWRLIVPKTQVRKATAA